jgi:hypothetical protein
MFSIMLVLSSLGWTEAGWILMGIACAFGGVMLAYTWSVTTDPQTGPRHQIMLWTINLTLIIVPALVIGIAMGRS